MPLPLQKEFDSPIVHTLYNLSEAPTKVIFGPLEYENVAGIKTPLVTLTVPLKCPLKAHRFYTTRELF